MFLSPRVQVKFNSTAQLQPWLSFGRGYADFSPASPRSGNVNVKGRGDSGTLEFGGGVDTRPADPIQRRSFSEVFPDRCKVRGTGLLLRSTSLRSRHSRRSSEQHCVHRRPADSVLAISLEDEVITSPDGRKAPSRLSVKEIRPPSEPNLLTRR